MDQKLEDLKKIYESPEIPVELSARVEQALADSQVQNDELGQERLIMLKGNTMEKTAQEKSRRSHRRWKGAAAAAAALVILTGGFGIGVHTSEAFADTVKDIPFLGAFARVFTAEEVKKDDNVANIDMKLPAVEGIADKAFEEKINTEIKAKMTDVVERTRKEAAENKQAWLDTGGEEKDYTPVDITVDYRVKSISEDKLSFVIFQTSTTASYYENQFYYNIDLKNNRELTLKDLLGENYVTAASEQIRQQIAERSKDPDAMFFDGSDGIPGFTEISPDQTFYVNTAGNPVIVFNKYEIAPGAMGIQEFEVTAQR